MYTFLGYSPSMCQSYEPGACHCRECWALFREGHVVHTDKLPQPMIVIESRSFVALFNVISWLVCQGS